MIKEVKTGTYFKGEEFFNFDFYTNLKTSDKLKFVNFITDLLVDDSRYNFVIRNLIFDYSIIKFFTTINTVELEASDFFLDDVEKFLEETNIVDIVKANVEVGLIEELNKSVDLNIEYLTGIHPSPLNDALTSLMNTLERKINEVDLNSMMEMASKFSGMTEEFTPESIVNAYLNSDVHKENVVEIAKSKEEKAKIAEDIDKVVNMADKVENDNKKIRKSAKKSTGE